MSKYVLRRLHWWLSLLLSLQLLAWFGSGLLMTAFPIEQVRGNDLRQAWPAADWHTVTLSPTQLQLQAPVQTLELTQQQQTPLYHIVDAGGERWVNAQTSAVLAPLTAAQATQLALTQYRGTHKVVSSQLLQEVPSEARGLVAPLFQVNFDDETSFYLHPVTGQLLRVRTALWRSYDIAWMLHIMDYDTRENSHNPLVIGFSLTALLFTLTGIMLLVQTKRRHSPIR